MSKFRRANITASKLTPEKVLELRREYHEEGRTQGSLARKYQISVGQVGRIVRGEAWQEYPEVENPSELEHRKALVGQTVSDDMIAESQKRLTELLATPQVDKPPDELCPHGTIRKTFCFECAKLELVEKPSVLDRLNSDIADERKLDAELDELLK